MGAHRYRAQARWIAGRSGDIEAEAIHPKLAFSAPPEFQGEAGLWTPEHFLIAAVVSCYITTFKAIAEFSQFHFARLEVAVEGRLEKEPGGYRFTEVTLRPELTLDSESNRDQAMRLLEKAERACLISRSLNSAVRLEAKVMAPAPA